MPGTNIRSKTSWLLHRKGQLFVYCTVQYIFLCFRETASPKKRLSRCLPLSSGISEFLSEKRGFFSSQPHVVFSRLKFQVQIIKFYFYFKNGKSRVFCQVLSANFFYFEEFVCLIKNPFKNEKTKIFDHIRLQIGSEKKRSIIIQIK